MSAVRITVSSIEHRAVFIEEVPSIYVVHVSIAIIVNAVNNLEWINPNVACEIRVGVLNAFVNYAHIDAPRSSKSERPRLLGV
jgi:hypothetical protein